MKSPVRPAAQHQRNRRLRITKIVIHMSEFVVGGLVPLGVRLNAHQRAHIVVEVEVPRRRMRVFFEARVRRYRIQRRFFPERRRQGLKTERNVELLRRMHHPLRRLRRHRRDDIDALDVDQCAPILPPAIRKPVGRELIGHGLVKARRQLVADPGMQFTV